jgi:tellurite resistance protein
MGLFSNLRNAVTGAAPTVDTQADMARAVMSIPMIIAAADGQISGEELHQLTNMLAFNPMYLRLGVERTRAMVHEIAADLHKPGGFDAVAQRAAKTLTPPMAETAIVLAVRVAAADGQIAPREREAIAILCHRLQIPDAVLERTVAVIAAMQRAA